MAGIIKRKDTWYACFRVEGKLKVRTTGIKIIPLVSLGLPPKCSTRLKVRLGIC